MYQQNTKNNNNTKVCLILTYGPPLFLGARSNSTRLRADVDNLQTQCANDMWSAWNNTNTSLQQRVTESTEAHNKLQSHHSKTMQEIYDQVHTYYRAVISI